jgi:phage minor structural protein
MIYVIGLDNRVRGVLTNDVPDGVPFWDDLNEMNLATGVDVFEFKCLAGNPPTDAIEVENYVAIEDKDGRLKLFKVREIQTIHDNNGLLYKQVYAESAALELLKTPIRPYEFSGAAPQTVLAHILQGTLWQAGGVEVTNLVTMDFNDYPNAVEAILKLAEESGAEVRYRVDIDGGRIIARSVDLLVRVGEYTGKRFTYSKDIEEIVRTEDLSTIYTAVIPVGSTPEGADAPVTISSVSGTFTNQKGTTIYKPIGQDYIGDPDALARWSDDGQHLTYVLKTDETSPQVLLQRGWEFLSKHNEPQMKYEAKVVVLERITGGEYAHEAVKLGDTLIVEDLDFPQPLVLEARVIEYGRSMSDPSQDYVVLGNFVELGITVEAQLRDLLDKIRRSEGEWQKDTEGEIITKTPTAPTDPVIGQLWLDTSVVPNVWKRWDGTAWVPATPTQAHEVGAETPEGAQDKADQAYADASEFTQIWAQKSITQSTSAPSAPAVGDLWIDISQVPHVWKRWTGSIWRNAVPTDLSQLAGQVTNTQISDQAITTPKIASNVITSEMIVTSGLDAGVIKFGTMTGITADLGQAGITATGSGWSTDVRFWAGSTFGGRDSAPFRVEQSGRVWATNINIMGGSINITENATVGKELTVGSSASGNDGRIKMGGTMWRTDGFNAYIGATQSMVVESDGDRIYLDSGWSSTRFRTRYETAYYMDIQKSSSTYTDLLVPARMRVLTAAGIVEFFNSSGGDTMMRGSVNGVMSTTLKWTSTGFQIRTSSDSALASIQASAFSTTSLREFKDDIVPIGRTIDKIRKTPVYDYVRTETEEGRENTRQVGVLHDEAPDDIKDSEETIDLYSMTSLLWKAVQELSDVVETLSTKTMPEADIDRVCDIFKPWTPGVEYAPGTFVQHGKKADGTPQLYVVTGAGGSTTEAPDTSAKYRAVGRPAAK